MIMQKIALRNLMRQKRRSFLLGGALAFGMLILTLVNGLTGGLLRSIEKNISGIAVGQIFFVEVERTAAGRIILSISDDRHLLSTIESLGISPTSVARRTMHQGNLVYAGESIPRGLSGVEWREESSLLGNLEMVSGSMEGMAGTNGILISVGAAERLNLVPKKEPDAKTLEEWAKFPKAEIERMRTERELAREEALRTSIGETILVPLSTIHGQQNLGEFTVAGIYRAQYDYYAYTDRAYLNELIGLPEDGYNQFGMFLTRFSEVDLRTYQLYQALESRYDMVPLEQIAGKSLQTVIGDLSRSGFTGTKFVITNINNELGAFKNIFATVQLVALGFFLVLLLVIMVGITNTFRIVVYERTREIGTMRSLGMRRDQVRTIFLLEALFLSLGGVAAGFLLASLILFVLRLIRWNIMPDISFFFDKGHLRVSLDPALFIGTVIVVSGLTLLAALIPARKAARLEPALALRTHY